VPPADLETRNRELTQCLAVSDQHEEVEVRPGVEARSFGADRTQGQQGERIIPTRKFPGQ
jgi:hypothetical protein